MYRSAYNHVFYPAFLLNLTLYQTSQSSQKVLGYLPKYMESCSGYMQIWLESEFSDRLWLEPSLDQAKQYAFVSHDLLVLVDRREWKKRKWLSGDRRKGKI
jgi:hypothetical protein